MSGSGAGGCDKRRFSDRVSALIALSKIRWKDSSARPKTEKRAYRCPKCGGWHLTSRPKREVKKDHDG